MSRAADEQIVRLGAQRIRVQEAGDGPALLLLNGLGAPLELWGPFLRHLNGVRTIAFDAPGSGGSDTPHLPLSIRGHAQLALQVLDELGHDTVSVLGLSFGGMIAQELAHSAPRRVERLVLASTSCGWGGVPGHPAALLTITTPERYYSRPLFEAVDPTNLGVDTARDDGALRPQRRNSQDYPPRTRGYLYQFLAAAAWSSLYWLGSLKQPTLIVAGDQDRLVPPANAALLAGLIPNAESHVVRGGDHLCLLEQAEEVAPLVAQFLRR